MASRTPIPVAGWCPRKRVNSKAVAKGTTADYSKCESKFSDLWGKTEAKAGMGVCPSEGDEAAIQDFLDACDASVAEALAGGALLLDPVTCDGALDACDVASGMCEATLASCYSTVASLDEDFNTCNGNLGTCTGDLGTCNGNLSTCSGDLATANGGTAAPGDVLVGKTFTSASGLNVTGTVPVGPNLVADGFLSGYVPAGLYSGSTTVTCSDADLVAGNVRSGVDIFGVVGDPNVVDTSSGDAVAADLAAGKIAWVDGAPVTGTSTPGSCGNGIVDGGDQCELGDLDGNDCTTVTGSFTGGTLACGAGCQFDVSGCSSGRFEDRGLTVVDHWNGLEWVKNNYAGGLTDNDNKYTWSSGSTGPDTGSAMTGSVFTVYLQGLNSSNYAGRRGWRLPTLEELQTIVDMSAAGCGSGSPCIDPVFGPTQSTYYWSSTTSQDIPSRAWDVYSNDGSTYAHSKTDSRYVRAVRAGS